MISSFSNTFTVTNLINRHSHCPFISLYLNIVILTLHISISLPQRYKDDESLLHNSTTPPPLSTLKSNTMLRHTFEDARISDKAPNTNIFHHFHHSTTSHLHKGKQFNYLNQVPFFHIIVIFFSKKIPHYILSLSKIGTEQRQSVLPDRLRRGPHWGAR